MDVQNKKKIKKCSTDKKKKTLKNTGLHDYRVGGTNNAVLITHSKIITYMPYAIVFVRSAGTTGEIWGTIAPRNKKVFWGAKPPLQKRIELKQNSKQSNNRVGVKNNAGKKKTNVLFYKSIFHIFRLNHVILW